MTQEQRTFFEKLYRENYNKLYLHAYALLRDQSLAEVAVQEAAQTACQNIDSLTSSQNPIGWMYKAIEHVALHLLRDIKRDEAMFSPLEEYDHEDSRIEPDISDRDLIDQCLTIISKEEFDLFWRIIVAGSTYQEEADRANISVWACYKRVNRIRKQLQRGLKKIF